jgi:transcriptional regulator with XRE-family HTH domain
MILNMSSPTDVKRPPPLTSAQIRAARALIRWSAEELAKAAEIGVSTIRRAELEPSETKLTRVNDQAIRRTLEAAGILFIDAEFGVGPGVRLKSPKTLEQ